MHIRRINLFAGPGAGKSTLATFLFYKLKCAGYSVEYTPEYVKKWTYYNRLPKSFDQIYLFAKQLHNEDNILNGGFDLAISDSPLLLVYYYATRYGLPGAEHIRHLAEEFEKCYPSINIFVERGDTTYQTVGRFQTLAQSKEIDTEIRALLPKMENFKYDQSDQIYNAIITKIGGPTYGKG